MIREIQFENQMSEINKYDDIKSLRLLGMHPENTPFFSIVIPTYQRDNTFFQALNSAINQLFDDYEIVVVENGKTHTSEKVLKYISETNNSRIIYYQNKENIGAVGNFNRASELAHGKYVLMLHDDDVLSPFALEMVFNLIKKRDSLVCVGLRKITLDYNVKCFKFEKPAKRIKYRMVNLESIYFNRSILLSGMTYKKELMIKLGGFKEEQGIIADNALIMDFAKNGEVAEIMVPSIAYRIQDNDSLRKETFDSILFELPQIWKYLSNTNLLTEIDYRFFYRLRRIQYVKGALVYWHKMEWYDYYLLSKDTIYYEKNLPLRIVQKIWNYFIKMRQLFNICSI